MLGRLHRRLTHGTPNRCYSEYLLRALRPHPYHPSIPLAIVLPIERSNAGLRVLSSAVMRGFFRIGRGG